MVQSFVQPNGGTLRGIIPILTTGENLIRPQVGVAVRRGSTSSSSSPEDSEEEDDSVVLVDLEKYFFAKLSSSSTLLAESAVIMDQFSIPRPDKESVEAESLSSSWSSEWIMPAAEDLVLSGAIDGLGVEMFEEYYDGLLDGFQV